MLRAILLILSLALANGAIHPAAAASAAEDANRQLLKRNYKTSAAILAWAADAGDADAQFRLGQMYRIGLGVPRDLDIAHRWLNRAARAGHGKAARLLKRWPQAGSKATGRVPPPLLEAAAPPRADVNGLAKDRGGNTWLARAAGRGLELELSWLVAPADRSALPAAAYKSPMLAAARAGRLDIVKLLAKETKLDAVGPQGESPLMLASAATSTGLMVFLLTHGADPAITDKSARTALDYAYSACNAEAAGILLRERNGAGGHDGRTSLLPAFVKQCPATGASQELLALSDADGTDPAGRTALWHAAAKGDVAWVEAILGRHPDLAVADAQGVTALHAAAARGQAEALSALLQAGAAAGAVDNDGNTPLMLAASAGCGRCTALLLTADQDIDAANRQGDTALLLAVRGGHGDAASILIAHGARRDQRNKQRETAQTLAGRLADPVMLSVLGDQ